MRKIRVIFFDCMETLIDLYEIPGVKEYAYWSYHGSGVEQYWQGFAEFHEHFAEVRKILREREPLYKEYDIHKRYKLVVEKKFGRKDKEKTDWIAEKLVARYWQNYKEKCYVNQEVIRVLQVLKKEYELGVISNFLVRGGIEELLAINGLNSYFSFIVSSVDAGWRKPHHLIYQAALRKAGVLPEELVFVGDDYVNDYLSPRQLGFVSLLYDREEIYPSVKWRFRNFSDLPQALNNL